ncbi:fibronectin type III domain-containing protein [Terribacillus sp. AE2B 122]|uniref:fibronectin type III domain-containing protein n=1 Tax=Terribacillus sp. AE2B 122 TaxID=1331902 RepID=UPI0015827913|nr:fibronectin type III domain-containing protein [Terribacillus sp. AE2B 122]
MTLSSKSDTSVSLTWDAVSYDGGIKQYEVFRDRASIGTRVGTNFADSGLTADTAYEYTVRAISNDDLYSPESDSLTVTTDPAPGNEGTT